MCPGRLQSCASWSKARGRLQGRDLSDGVWYLQPVVYTLILHLQAMKCTCDRRSRVGKIGLMTVKEFLQNGLSKTDFSYDEYVAYALRFDGPALYGKPSPLHCVNKEAPGYIVCVSHLIFACFGLPCDTEATRALRVRLCPLSSLNSSSTPESIVTQREPSRAVRSA
jgi:hypothetical protein